MRASLYEMGKALLLTQGSGTWRGRLHKMHMETLLFVDWKIWESLKTPLTRRPPAALRISSCKAIWTDNNHWVLLWFKLVGGHLFSTTCNNDMWKENHEA